MKLIALLACAWACSALTGWTQGTGDSPQAQRERDLKIPEILQALALKPASRVADIGAGEGAYEPALSRSVGAGGRVYAEDIDRSALQRLRERIASDRLDNVEVIAGAPDDPKLPAGSLDAVLMVIMYHEIEDYRRMLERIAAALKPEGRLVVVDLMPRKTLQPPRQEQAKNHVIAPDLVEAELRQAGFEPLSRVDRFIDRPDDESTRWMIVCRRTAAIR